MDDVVYRVEREYLCTCTVEEIVKKIIRIYISEKPDAQEEDDSICS